MMWTKIMSLFLGSTFLVAQSVPQSIKTPTIDELQSYDCARSVAKMYEGEVSLGPLFLRDNLAFTSVGTAGRENLLIVNAGRGTFSILLPSSGVNKIRFDLPNMGRSGEHSYYLSFMHGGRGESRVFEFGFERPPLGHDDLEYHPVQVQRADELLPHFEYAIFTTAQKTVQALASGKINRTDVFVASLDRCSHLERRAPNLASNLRHHLNTLDVMVYGNREKIKTKLAGYSKSGSRGPASVR